MYNPVFFSKKAHNPLRLLPFLLFLFWQNLHFCHRCLTPWGSDHELVERHPPLLAVYVHSLPVNVGTSTPIEVRQTSPSQIGLRHGLEFNPVFDVMASWQLSVDFGVFLPSVGLRGHWDIGSCLKFGLDLQTRNMNMTLLINFQAWPYFVCS